MRSSSPKFHRLVQHRELEEGDENGRPPQLISLARVDLDDGGTPSASFPPQSEPVGLHSTSKQIECDSGRELLDPKG